MAASFGSIRDVLIPRPETEHVIEAVLQRVGPDATILDVGCGSGAIAVTLALELPGARVLAADISHDALIVARQNAVSLRANVHYFQCDLLTSIGDHTLNAVVSNPPYVARRDQPALQPEVRDWEPALALFGGEDGYQITTPLIVEAARVLKSGGLLVMEIGDGQAKHLASVANLFFETVHYDNDLAGIARVITAEKPNRNK